MEADSMEQKKSLFYVEIEKASCSKKNEDGVETVEQKRQTSTSANTAENEEDTSDGQSTEKFTSSAEITEMEFNSTKSDSETQTEVHHSDDTKAEEVISPNEDKGKVNIVDKKLEKSDKKSSTVGERMDECFVECLHFACCMCCKCNIM